LAEPGEGGALLDRQSGNRKFFNYLLLSIIFWTVVDFTTVFSPDLMRWSSYMPGILIYYIGYPLAFSLLIYKARIGGWKLFALTAFGALLAEMVFFHNPLVLSFPVLLLGVPLAIAIYSFITYAPLWIVEGKVKENKAKLILLSAAWALVSILTFITNIKKM
jgi:hypothetical protein